VGIDSHIEVERYFYRVPAVLVRQEVEVRLTAGVVEVLHQGRRVASHVRSDRAGQCVTNPPHWPLAHQKHLEWTPTRLLAWAEQIDPGTAAVVHFIRESRPHPAHGYRSCLGLHRLSQHSPPTGLEAACTRALALGVRSYRSVKSILEHGLDHQVALQALTAPPDLPSAAHAHVRGAAYYQEEIAHAEPAHA
jgi:hypothetical protein